MKSLARALLGIQLFGLFILPAQAFTSFYVFGDSSSTTTDPLSQGPPSFYGKRWTNGRTWVEVLTQWQGLTYDSNKNWSYYGQYSSNLVANVNQFAAPSDANTALFAVWVNNADFVDYMNRFFTLPNPTNLTQWTTNMNLSLTNHFKAVTNLYAKGMRTLILPNVVDITKIPEYNLYTDTNRKAFVRQRVISYNTTLSTTWYYQVKSNCPNLTVYFVDVFSLMDDMIAHAANYGLTNALSFGQPIDVIEDPSLVDKSLNGPGAIYVFWNYNSLTAKANMWIADVAQRQLSSVQITGITSLGASNQLDVINVPAGRSGVVEATTNFVNWSFAGNVNTNFVSQSIFLPVAGDQQFYRLRFPFSWVWP